MCGSYLCAFFSPSFFVMLLKMTNLGKVWIPYQQRSCHQFLTFCPKFEVFREEGPFTRFPTYLPLLRIFFCICLALQTNTHVEKECSSFFIHVGVSQVFLICLSSAILGLSLIQCSSLVMLGPNIMIPYHK